MADRLLAGPFTVDHYHRLAELGILGEDDRVELLDGQVVEMTPIGPPHAACVKRLNQLLGRAGTRAVVSVQDPVVLGPRSEPEPDLALLQPPLDRYATRHPAPADILLVIEVADTSVESDRNVKIPLYAAAGVPEVWLVDLAGRQVEVFRSPAPGGYSFLRTLRAGDAVTVDALPHLTIEVRDILG